MGQTRALVFSTFLFSAFSACFPFTPTPVSGTIRALLLSILDCVKSSRVSVMSPIRSRSSDYNAISEQKYRDLRREKLKTASWKRERGRRRCTLSSRKIFPFLPVPPVKPFLPFTFFVFEIEGFGLEGPASGKGLRSDMAFCWCMNGGHSSANVLL